MAQAPLSIAQYLAQRQEQAAPRTEDREGNPLAMVVDNTNTGVLSRLKQLGYDPNTFRPDLNNLQGGRIYDTETGYDNRLLYDPYGRPNTTAARFNTDDEGLDIVTKDGKKYLRHNTGHVPGKEQQLMQSMGLGGTRQWDDQYGWLQPMEERNALIPGFDNLNFDAFSTYAPALMMAVSGNLAGLHGAAVGAQSLGSSLGQATGLSPGTGAGAAAGAGAPVSQIPLFGQAPLAGIPVSANAAWMAPGASAASASGVGGVQNYTGPANEFGGYSTSNAYSLPDALDPSGALGDIGASGGRAIAGTGAGTAASSLGAPTLELGRQAGFLDTLRNVGLGQAVGNSLGFGQMGALGGVGTALGLGNAVKGLTSQQDNSSVLGDLLRAGITGAQTYIGYNEAQDRADAANKQSDLARQIYETEHGYRLPFIQDATNILQNPNDYFNRPDVKGSVDATLRGLSADVGNPFGNPTALAKSAAYNLGGYQNALNSATGRAGIGNSASIGGLGNQYGNSIMNAANAGAGPGAALSYGLGGLGSLLSRTNPYLLT